MSMDAGNAHTCGGFLSRLNLVGGYGSLACAGRSETNPHVVIVKTVRTPLLTFYGGLLLFSSLQAETDVYNPRRSEDEVTGFTNKGTSGTPERVTPCSIIK
jgi:hypothetical protein